ncbi:metal ABC transporter substrate-binding protein [Saccharopolyspora griseoalba]|uniref:Metal ABC transporter substrate-binding protein n=1 Tax=Saccharopolyspora griseoalba TaxID=1431848 RepID=A0ABW2LE78_9PSEU
MLALALVLTTGCGTVSGEPDDGRKHVVTTFTVIAEMARNVAGDALVVDSITKPGVEIHEYEPTPSDMLTAAKADLVLDNGLGLERWFERFVERSEAEHVTLTRGIDPIPIRNGAYRGAANPHAWMSPRNAAIYVTNIRDAFIRLDPAHAEVFRANAEAYLAEIAGIDRYLREQLAALPESRRALVTCEGAFSYLARDARLREAYLWPVNSTSEGTPQQIKATTRFVRDHDVPTLFCESTVNDRAQRQVARETGTRLGAKLYVDSLSEPGGPVPTYLDLLRHDARAIVEGLRREPA